ncbi:MAG: gephyrin-like molybdotransferase Glp [Bacteroidia bacterium]
MNPMITPAEAMALTLDSAPLMTSEEVPLDAALGRVLANDVASPIDHPLFDQTAVDGYCFRHADWIPGTPLRVAGQVRAGDSGDLQVMTGECIRIFTGAPLPMGTDTIVMQEHVVRDGDVIHIRDMGIREGANRRSAGEQIRSGERALAAGTRLNPAGIGFLASLGIQSVEVRHRPRVCVLVTGDEFAASQEDLQHGKIFESNGQMLLAALQAGGCEAEYATCPDNPEALTKMVTAAASAYEVLILTGGVSVGDFDFSRVALEGAGFEAVFHQVAQKPGKPLLLCRRGLQRAFGLPGNPRASMMCYLVYVLPLLDAMEGSSTRGLPTLRLPLGAAYRRKPDGKVHFISGNLQDMQAMPLSGQQSHMLQSLAEGNLIIQLPAEPDDFPAGFIVDCLLLP